MGAMQKMRTRRLKRSSDLGCDFFSCRKSVKELSSKKKCANI